MRNRDYEKEIADLEAKLAETRAEKRKVDAMPPEQRIADMLHMATCRHNHSDACGYLYEKWDSPGHAKGRELSRVRALLQVVDEQTLEKIVLVLDRHS